MNYQQAFKQTLADQSPVIGSFIKTPNMMLCEVLAQTQLQVFCLDAEHSPFDRTSLDACLFALHAHQKPSLVRVPDASKPHILNALDCGATGIIIPHVTQASQLQSIVKSCYFGEGGRGYAGSSRFAKYTGNSIATNLQNNRQQTCVLPQLEDLEALDNLEDLMQVEGVDCFFIGVMDLTVALGCDSPADHKVVKAVEHICQVAQKHQQKLGMFIPKVKDVGYWQQRGVSLFLLSSDHGFLKQGASHLYNQFTAQQ